MEKIFDFSDYIADHTRDFVGREWVFAKIDAWLADPDAPRYFIITGEPGIGKTAIAARLTQISSGAVLTPDGFSRVSAGFLSAHHFCSARNGGWIVPDGFSRSLSQQLVARYPRFGDAIVENLQIIAKATAKTNLGTMIAAQINHYYAESSELIFNNLVRHPLKALQDIGPIVILVDGLDESLNYTKSVNIAHLLTTLGEYEIPNNVRFLITTRPIEHILRHFRHFYRITLSACSEENQQDVQRYVNVRFADSEGLKRAVDATANSQVIETLGQRSAGNFLVMAKVLGAMERGDISLDDPNALPTDLQHLYAWFLDRLTQGDWQMWRRLYRPVLGMLCAAYEPISVAQLYQWTGLPRQDILDAIHDLREFVDMASDDHYHLYHESMADFLTGNVARSDYGVDVITYHQQIAASYTQWFTKKKDWCDCDTYCLRYLTMHLIEAGHLEITSKLLVDFDWLQAKLNAIGVLELISDYRKVLLLVSEESQGILAIWEAFFLENAHILMQGSEYWAANRILLQLATECANNSVISRTAETWLQSGKCDWVWLRRKDRTKLAKSTNIRSLTFSDCIEWSWVTDCVMKIATEKEEVKLDFSNELQVERTMREKSPSPICKEDFDLYGRETARENDSFDVLGRFSWQHYREQNWGSWIDVWVYRGKFYMAWGENQGEPSSYERTVVSPTLDAFVLVTSDGFHQVYRICNCVGDLESKTIHLPQTEQIVAVSPRARYLFYVDEFEHILYVKAILWDTSFYAGLDNTPSFDTRRWGYIKKIAIIETNEGIVSLQIDKDTAIVNWLLSNNEQVFVFGTPQTLEWEIVHLHGDDVGIACIANKKHDNYEECKILWRLWDKSTWMQATIEWSTQVIGVKRCQLVPDGTVQVEFENYYIDYYDAEDSEWPCWYQFSPGSKAVPIDKPQRELSSLTVKYKVQEQDTFLQLEVSEQAPVRWYGSKGLVWVLPSSSDNEIAVWVLNPNDGWEPFPLVWM